MFPKAQQPVAGGKISILFSLLSNPKTTQTLLTMKWPLVTTSSVDKRSIRHRKFYLLKRHKIKSKQDQWEMVTNKKDCELPCVRRVPKIELWEDTGEAKYSRWLSGKKVVAKSCGNSLFWVNSRKSWETLIFNGLSLHTWTFRWP